MADIFISYTRGDAARVAELAAELEHRDFSVFWDTEVLPGQLWRDVIHDELVQASCVIVVWSQGSTRSRWVVEEASEALEAGKLLPVLLDGSLPPFGFRAVEAAILSDWTPGAPSQEFDNLVDAVRRIVAESQDDDVLAEAPPAEASDDDQAPEPAAPPIVLPIAEEPAEPQEPTDLADMPQTEHKAAPTVSQEEQVPATSPKESVETQPDDQALRAGAQPDWVPPTLPEEPVQERRVDDSDQTPPPTSVAPVPDGRPPIATGDPRPERDGMSKRPEGLVARFGTLGTVGIGAAAVLVIVLGIVIASGGGDGDPPTTTLAGGGSPPIGEISTTVDDRAGTSTAVDDAAVTEILERDTVSAFPAITPPNIDGNLGEWDGAPEAYRLRTEVFRDPDVVDRLGDDSPGVVIALYDDTALYLAVVSEDDIYSQQNSGNQIWRGDALNINLTTATSGAISERPDGDDFQLTMTPQAADGRPSIVWFTGNGSGFDDNTTNLPVVLAGAINNDGSWQLEAAIPWSVFGLSGPPSGDLAALVAVFDNDGEVVDGRPQQTVILGHTSAEFQRPLTWGTLRLERPG